MFRSLMLASIVSLATIQGAQAVTLDEFNAELKKSSQILVDQVTKLAEISNTLSKEDCETLAKTTTDGVPNIDLLMYSFDATMTGVSGFVDYLDGLNKPEVESEIK